MNDRANDVDRHAASTRKNGGALARVWDWFLGTSQIAQARVRAVPLTDEQLALLGRARRARELAERVLDPVEPLANGPGLDLALELNRQAAYWALLSFAPQAPLPSESELWSDSESVLATLTPLPEGLAETFVTPSAFTSFADRPESETRASATRMRGLVDALLATIDRPHQEVVWLRLMRAIRVVVALIVVGVIGWLAVTVLVPERPDLAIGKPWKASSALFPCHPEIPDCGGAKTRILFHTVEETSPWFEYDLGKPVTFSALTIRNRMDYGPDRAVPLVVEVSDDGKAYREIVRRDKTFDVWEPKFPKTTARFVRLRADRRTYLHLEAVKIHP